MSRIKVQKHTLLLIACFVWSIAGFNILHIGLIEYRDNLSFINIVLSLIIFTLFQFMVFGKLVRKHTNRIIGYSDEKQLFLKFFDVKSFCIMAFMMSGGIALRVSGICPNICIAVFYTGLGASLFLAGILFGYNYLKTSKNIKQCM